MTDTVTDYDARKKKYDDMITLYGRKPVLEVLSDKGTSVHRLHLADSNKQGGIIAEILALAGSRDIEVVHHSRAELSRISRNARQDQGVAVDIDAPSYRSLTALPDEPAELLVLDGVTNPQNLGMIIRSVAASPAGGLVLPKKGCARLDPLVHKASAGTLIRAPIYHCPTLESGLKSLRSKGYSVVGLDSNTPSNIGDVAAGQKTAFVLGNETTGLSDVARKHCDQLARIPLNPDVESH